MPPEQQPSTPPVSKKSFKFPQGLKLICLILAIIVVGMGISILFFWKPWQPNIKASDRVVTVTGEATLTATPDEYVFTPAYTFSDANQQTALSQVTSTSDQIVAKLKALGVKSSAIQTNANGYSSGNYVPVFQNNKQTTYQLNLTITIDDATLAQKVQDYLVTTSPTGDVTPSVNFSTATQKSLENKARNQAEIDARSKADQSAKNLGFKVANVKTVIDGGLNSGGMFDPCGSYGGSITGGACSGSNLDVTSGNSAQSLTLQPGQNQLYYSVQVEYYIH